jgi:hypothetical protein
MVADKIRLHVILQRNSDSRLTTKEEVAGNSVIRVQLTAPTRKLSTTSSLYRVARLSSEDDDGLSSALSLVRVFVAMVLKVSLLEVLIGRLRRAMCEQLQSIRSFSVVVPSVASMSFWCHSPIYHLVPIATLSNLSVTNMMPRRCRHGGVICHAHDILSQPG